MKNQYEYTINPTEDISKALAEAERAGYRLTLYNSTFHLRGEAGHSIAVDDSLADLYVKAHGPSPVEVSGEGKVIVHAGDEAVVYAQEASVYVSSDWVDVNAYGNSRVYLPDPGIEGSRANVSLNDDASLIQSRSRSN